MSFTRRRLLIEQLQQASSVEELHRCGTAIAAAYDFDHFLYGASIPTSFVQPQAIIISGYPQPWRDHYIASDYQRIDPTVHHCARHLTPLVWSDVRLPNHSVAALMQECSDFGLANGVSLPSHGPGGEFAMLNFASRHDGARSAQLIENALADTLLLTAHFHETARRLVSLVELPAAASLSAREKECLLWSAEGKTSWEISQILNISERTVIFHLQHVSEKLQVSNRQHAVARAISLGLISPQHC